MLKVNEIYYSVQGESTKAGLPCVFIRLTFCNLRCTYCDTEYAFYDGVDMELSDIISKVKEYGCKLVELTGGEPLVQKESFQLMSILCDEGFEVMLETSGSLSTKEVDERVKVILDFKCPSSGMVKKNFYENVNYLKPIDEVKFVIGSREDFEWSRDLIAQYSLDKKCEVLFSIVFGRLSAEELVNWILEEKLNVRFQLQMHKVIWEPMKRGV